ncbi:MAG TPA: FAD-binding oxidoreductase [Candidatus Limnocylindria bacterium]|nr:FAD-binding oxidoreductase [Candidatus Limnocylindria bacterium]
MTARLHAERVREETGVCAAAAIDGAVPRWVVTPVSLEEMAAVVALAHDARLAVAVRGAGSALELGRPPLRLDVVVDLQRLDRVLEYEPDDLTVTVQAGVTAGALAQRLAAHRQHLPVDPCGWAARTVGGLAATHASGPLRARYGTMRDLLLGVRFVQADGVVTWGGAKVVKSVTGYDVPKLMTGALGTLGVLGELTLRLHPLPEFEGTWLLAFRSPAAAQECVNRLVDSTVQPSRVELLNERATAACGLPRAAAAVALSVATVEPAVRSQQAVIASTAQRAGGTVQPMGATFWRTYDRALADAPGVRLRVAALVSRLAETVRQISETLTPAPLIAGTATAGVLRAVFAAGDVAVTGRGIERLRAMVAEGGGSVVIERGPRALRVAVDPWGPVPEPELAIMRALKHEFDPRGVLSPGRFVGGL